MRTFLDVIESLTDGLRMIVGLITLFIFASVFVMTFGASYVIGNATDELADYAEVATQEAAELKRESIKASRKAERDRALAKEGWGFEDAAPAYRRSDGFGEETGPENDRRRKRRRRDNDWGSAQ